ncbi:MAG: hypothetical protein SFU98_01500 [Leptospiraceae bacterium]|nr:hypothetical protein [Leptospiraceae bacterium]
MNAGLLKQRLKKLSFAKVEKLGSSELSHLSNLISEIESLLDTIEIQAKVQILHQSIKVEERNFYNFLLGKKKIKKPNSKSKRVIWEKYLKQNEEQFTKIKDKKKEISKILERVFNSSLEEGVKILSKLKAEDKKLTSLLASLSGRNSYGVTKLGIGNSKKSLEKWILEHKNIKNLGVL